VVRVGERGDELLDRVVVATGVGEVVAVDAAGVGEQVASSQDLGGRRVAQPKAGHVVANGTVEVQHAVIHQLLDQRGCPDLGD
jgi:hypothetical protein